MMAIFQTRLTVSVIVSHGSPAARVDFCPLDDLHMGIGRYRYDNLEDGILKSSCVSLDLTLIYVDMQWLKGRLLLPSRKL